MSAPRLIWPLSTRKVLLFLGAIFVAWSWYVHKPAPAPAPAPAEPLIEYLWA
jgi:hypothetical protein